VLLAQREPFVQPKRVLSVVADVFAVESFIQPKRLLSVVADVFAVESFIQPKRVLSIVADVFAVESFVFAWPESKPKVLTDESLVQSDLEPVLLADEPFLQV
jgi:hypothetical protein